MAKLHVPQVREFSVTDIQPFPIKLVWETNKKEDVGEMEVFPRYRVLHQLAEEKREIFLI